MNRTTTKALLLALALVGAVALPGVAELLTLRDGRPLMGEIQSATEREVRIRLFDGGQLTIPWEEIIERDAYRLQKRLGFIAEEETEFRIPGLRLTLEDGSVYEGVSLPARRAGVVAIKLESGPREFPESRVSMIEEIAVRALDAYTPRQLYTRRLSEAEPQTAEDHFGIVAFCQKIGDYEKALEHLETLETDFPEFKAEGVRLQKETVKVLLSQQEAVNLFDDVRKSAYRKMYDRALESLTKLEEGYPDSPLLEKIVRYRLTRPQLEAQKRGLDRERVTSRYYHWMRELATQKVRDREMTLAEAKSYAERELADDIAAKVAETEGFEVDEVKELFAERQTNFKRRSTYGPGTFLVEKPKKKDQSQQRGSRGRRNNRRSSNQRQQPQIERKPPKPDDWWMSASPATRRDWMLAWYAERSSDVEVLRIEYRSCPRCGGRGYLSILGSTGGGTQRIVCDRSWALGKDRVVVFR